MTESIEFLTVDDVVSLHEEQLRLFGGLAGIRDQSALESAVAMPAASFDREFLHSTVFEMAAAYAFHIAKDHPFIDGNKRAGLNAALVFLGLNGWDLNDPNDQLYDAMLGLAEGLTQKAEFAVVLEALAVPVVDD